MRLSLSRRSAVWTTHMPTLSGRTRAINPKAGAARTPADLIAATPAAPATPVSVASTAVNVSSTVGMSTSLIDDERCINSSARACEQQRNVDLAVRQLASSSLDPMGKRFRVRKAPRRTQHGDEQSLSICPAGEIECDAVDQGPGRIQLLDLTSTEPSRIPRSSDQRCDHIC